MIKIQHIEKLMEIAQKLLEKKKIYTSIEYILGRYLQVYCYSFEDMNLTRHTQSITVWVNDSQEQQEQDYEAIIKALTVLCAK